MKNNQILKEKKHTSMLVDNTNQNNIEKIEEKKKDLKLKDKYNQEPIIQRSKTKDRLEIW